MCKQDVALEMLKNNKEIPNWAITLHSAQAKDYKEMQLRMSNLEKDVSEIKDNMVKKDDLQSFKDEILPEIRKAAQFDLVKKGWNWKTIVGVVIVFLILVILFAFGIRGLEIIAPIGNTAVAGL